MYSFDYVRPASVADAAQALSHGDATLLAGGQTLLPTLKQRLAQTQMVVDLRAIPDLQGIRRQGDTLTIGAMTTHSEVADSADVASAIPALGELASEIGDLQVRNMGTIGGSLANDDPAADYPAAVLALGATVITDQRQIAADDFFQGLFTTALGPNEIITAVSFPIPKRAGYDKFAQRASRFALVGVFVAETAGGVRVAVTGAGDSGVFRSSELEAALASDFSPAAAAKVTVPSTGLLSDLHASADYRAALIPVAAERAVASAR